MTKVADPSLNRRRLRIALRRAREAAGITQIEAAQALHWSLSKVIRIEQGAFGLSVTDLRAMLALYDVSDVAQAAELEEAALRSKGSAWWAEYREVIGPRFGAYLGYEQAADSICVYHPVIIPSLLQTMDYAHALSAPYAADGHRQQKLRELLPARQERVFDEGNECRLFFIVDGAALLRLIGGSTVMCQQLRHLKEVSQRRNVDLRVLPLTAGAHLATTTGFVLFGFADDDDLLYLENTAEQTHDELEQVQRFRECFEELSSAAASDAQALAAISKAEEIIRA